MRVTARLLLVLSLVVSASGAERPRNLFANPGFEMGGTGPYRMDKGGQTVARFEVAKEGAVDGQRCVRVAVERAESWGTQFGQIV